MRATALILLLFLGACEAPPKLPALAESGAAPALAPLDQVITAASRQSAQPNPTGAVAGRAARLNARAAALRAPVLSAADRQRLTRGPRRPAALQ